MSELNHNYKLMEETIELLNKLFYDEISIDDIPELSERAFWELNQELSETDVRSIIISLQDAFVENVHLKNSVVYSLWEAYEDELALEILDNTIRSSNSYSFYLKGLISDCEHDRDSAIKSFEISLLLDKENIKSKIELARVLEDQKYKSTVISELKDNSKLDKDDLINLIGLSNNITDQIKLLVRVAKLSDDLDLVYNQFLEIDSYDEDLHENIDEIRGYLSKEISEFPYVPSLLFIRSELELNSNNFFEAYYFIKKALEINPISLILIGHLISISEVFEHQYDPNEELSLFIFRKLKDHFKYSITNDFNFGDFSPFIRYFNDLAKYSESLFLLDKINKDRDSDDFLFLETKTLIFAGDHKNARINIEKLSHFRPSKKYSLLLKDFYISKDDIKNAEQTLLDFIQLEENEASVYFDLYIFYRYHLIDLDKSLKFLDLDISQSEEFNSSMKFRRAELLKDLNRIDEALVEIDDCLKICDENSSEYIEYLSFKEILMGIKNSTN